MRARDLQPNAIWISHEHSDHFHPQTLLHFEKSTPIYVPAFPNGRLEKRLSALGFSNVHVIPFGERVKINKDFYITIYEPASLWNDAQVLLEIESFRILNMNDAGINHRIHQEIQRLDCICAAFSPGASGYPATHTHLNDEQKIEIYERSRVATLDMLFEACLLYGARYFLPFASHFILNHPKHARYMQLVRKNTIYDVRARFEGSDTEVIAMLAGDSWWVGGQVHRLARREDLYEGEVILSHIHEDFDEAEFNVYYPREAAFNKDVVYNYFENLNQIPDIVFCENLSVNIYPDSSDLLAFSFTIQDGVLSLQPTPLESAHLIIKIPVPILMYICEYDESWDEATIGYWCECARNPDVYHTEFWRLLQAPYYLKKPHIPKTRDEDFITKNSNLASVLERLGVHGEKVLGRYGLYCLSCNKATMESIEQACHMHGIHTARMERLIGELRVIEGSLGGC